jgi:hypothetical protein
MSRSVAAVLILVCLAAAPPARAQGQEHPHQSVNLSLFWPAATNSDPLATASVRLNLIHGRLGAVKAFDLNGIVGRTYGDVSGLQLTGAYSRTDGELRGVSLAGGINYVGTDARWAQFGFLASYTRGKLRGVQGAVGLSLVTGGFEGVQLASGFNLNEGDAVGLQFAGLTNGSRGELRGVQLAGFSNAAVSVRGAQIAAVNLAGDLTGAALGGVNYYGRDVHGVTVGALNWTEGYHHGLPFGLVNLARNGRVEAIVFSSNLSAVNAGIRTEVNRFYSMLTGGTVDVLDEIDGTIFVTWNFGYEFVRAGGFTLGADVGYVHVGPGRTDDPDKNGEPHPGFQVRGLVDYRFSDRFSVFGGGGVTALGTSYDDDGGSSTSEPLVFAGVSLF